MGRNILVVDDDEIIVRSCAAVLNGEGHEVSGVLSAKEAMNLIKKNTYDLIITDIIMPTIDGLELIKWVNDNYPYLRIIVITGFSSKAVLRDAIALDISEFLPKPFFPQMLIDTVNKTLSTPPKVPLPQKSVEIFDTESLLAITRRYSKKRGALIMVLQEAQELIGYLPASAQKIIAKGMKTPVSEVYAVVSFYSFFTMKPMGKYNVRVCQGTACYVKRANEIMEHLQDDLGIKEGEITHDNLFSLETVRCIGACGLAPVVVVDNDTFGKVDPAKTNELLKHYR
ncbi:MAG: NAD(P)H-dependent oxidoreductase subunit E [Nitrospirae bacterium]|nr:NAD(P)H-dependent oxidoreductase subunit E [Nitrospirota bacterium]MBF0591948.1 NAD(P)H-dependent oxidoreductase subunit E [Nitrospirota bacterium]